MDTPSEIPVEKKSEATKLTATEVTDTSSSVLSEAAGEPLQSKSEIDFMKLIVVGVTITMFIGFAGAFIAVGALVNDWLAQRHATEQSTRDGVKALGESVDALREDVRQLNQQEVKEPQNE